MRIIILALFAITTAFGEVLPDFPAVATRTVPPDFPEIDFGVAVKGDHFTTRVLNSCGLTGQTRGGLWIGTQKSKTEWDADAFIPYNYARSHKGVFSGTYEVCGSGGSGGPSSPQPLTWRGGADAGHVFVGPMMLDFLYVHSFDIGQATLDLYEAYAEAKGTPPSFIIRGFIGDTMLLLGASANPEPPSSFSSEADWAVNGKSPQQYRGFNKVSITVYVNRDGRIFDHILFGKDKSAGYTPLPGGIYLAGEFGDLTNESTVVTDSFIQFHSHLSTRLSTVAAFPVIASIGANVPYVWSDIFYRMNNDGTYHITVKDSHFPTHNLYLSQTVFNFKPEDWQLQKELAQENLAQFMYEDEDAVECPDHSGSPSDYVGQADAQ